MGKSHRGLIVAIQNSGGLIKKGSGIIGSNTLNLSGNLKNRSGKIAIRLRKKKKKIFNINKIN